MKYQLCTIAHGKEIDQIGVLKNELARRGFNSILHVLIIDFPDCLSLYPKQENVIYYRLDDILPKFWISFCFAFEIAELKNSFIPFFIHYLLKTLNEPIIFISSGVIPKNDVIEKVSQLETFDFIYLETKLVVAKNNKILNEVVKNILDRLNRHEIKFLLNYNFGSIIQSNRENQNQVKTLKQVVDSDWIDVLPQSHPETLPDNLLVNLSQFPSSFPSGQIIQKSDRSHYLVLHRFAREVIGNPFQNEQYFRSLIVVPTNLRFGSVDLLLWRLKAKLKSNSFLRKTIQRLRQA